MATRAASPLKSVALPAEHGGWGFTLEPILLGLALTPSLAGLGVGVMGLFAFLAHHPVKLALSDLRRGHRYPRTRLAATVGLAYAALAGLGLVLALFTARAPFLCPLLLGLPLAFLKVGLDAAGRGRTFTGEMAGALGAATLAPAAVLAGGGDPAWALGSWLVLALRSLVSIRYARAAVRRARGLPVSRVSVLATVATGAILAAVGAAAGLFPWLGALAIWALGGYALWVLGRPPLPAKKVGWGQMFWGWTTVLLVALGYWLGV